MEQDRDRLAREFAAICSAASVAVMKVYQSDFSASQKADRSPVTEADHAAEAIILEALGRLLPGVPVLAEEAFEAGTRPDAGREFFLVDPVDGTKEFINRNGQFTINIALIKDRVPVAGCVFAPALNAMFAGGRSALGGIVAPGETGFQDSLAPITARLRQPGQVTAVMSRSHLDAETLALAEAEGVTERISAGSSLKFCMLAEGKADLYPRFSPTMEWDTAAGHAVLAAAGGQVTRPDGSPFLYGKVETGFLNGPFVARGQPGS